MSTGMTNPLRACFAAFFVICGGPALALCSGPDLLAEMAPATRDELTRAAHAQPYPEGLLWRAERGDEVIHLLGTLHTHDPRHAGTLDRVRPIMQQAATIMLEMADGDEQRLQAEIAANPGLAFITDGPTLPEQLPPEDWEALKAAFAQAGIPAFLGAKMRPWMAMASLSVPACATRDIMAGKRGLDALIIETTREMGNPARALEGWQTVLNMFAPLPDAQMMDMLRLTVAMSAADLEAQISTLTEAYFREEVRLLWEWSRHLAAQLPDVSEEELEGMMTQMEDVLIATRNRAWMDRILPVAAEGPVFIAAGALHLPGDVGLLNLLEQEGFTITRLSLAE